MARLMAHPVTLPQTRPQPMRLVCDTAGEGWCASTRTRASARCSSPGSGSGQYARRLVLAGPDLIIFVLAALDEAVVSHERLLLVLRDGVGLVIEVGQPRLLRVEIAAARAAQR